MPSAESICAVVASLLTDYFKSLLVVFLQQNGYNFIFSACLATFFVGKMLRIIAREIRQTNDRT
jgi:hypothetical protein